MKRRLFVHPLARPGARLELDVEDLRHAHVVLRLKPGTAVEVVDGSGGRFAATYAGAEPPQLVVHERIVPTRGDERDGAQGAGVEPVTVVLASVRSARMDWAAEKLSELGIATLVPLETARGVAPPRLERLRRIARESAKQCGRAALLQVTGAMALEPLLAWIAPDTERLLLDPEGPLIGVADVGRSGEVVLLVGPEGGFTDAERQLAVSRGFRPVRITGLTLRAETAAIAGAVAVLVLRAGAR